MSANDLAGAPRLNAVFFGQGEQETPGYTAVTISRATFRQVLADGKTPYAMTNLEDAMATAASGAAAGLLSSRLTYRGQLTVASRRIDSTPVLLAGRRTKLPSVHLHGAYAFQEHTLSADYWVLADSAHPLLLKTVMGTDVFQMIRIDFPAPPARREEQELGMNCRLELPGIYSAFNSAELEPASEPALTGVATLLQRHVDWSFTIEGHTDSIGTAASNAKLSTARSEAVRTALVRATALRRRALPPRVLARPARGNRMRPSRVARGPVASSSLASAIAPTDRLSVCSTDLLLVFSWRIYEEVDHSSGVRSDRLGGRGSLAFALAGCQRTAPSSQGGERATVASGDAMSTLASGAAMPTLPARPDPCGWVPADSVSALVGPLVGPPKRGSHYDDPSPDEKGYACVYTLVARPEDIPTGEPSTVAIELRLDDAAVQEAGYRAGGALTATLAKQLNGGKPVAADTMGLHQDGWDYQSSVPDGFLGRIGHLGVFVGMRVLPALEPSRVKRLAALVRDHVPDEPFASYRPQHEGGDPCKLITRPEAEAVLGKLVYPPFRSTEEMPLADPGGAGCSYYVGQHRVFTVKPELEMGRQLFKVAAGTSQFFGSAAHLPNRAADTLDGVWDQAAEGTDGTLYFLKGDKMLTVIYRTSNVGIPDALKLVNIALGRI